MLSQENIFPLRENLKCRYFLFLCPCKDGNNLLFSCFRTAVICHIERFRADLYEIWPHVELVSFENVEFSSVNLGKFISFENIVCLE